MAGADLLADESGHLPADRGMDDPVECLHRVGVAEHTGGQRGTVERAILADHIAAEPFGNRVEDGRSGPLHVTHDLIGIDQHRTTVHQHLADRRLPGADAAGQSHQDHRREGIRGIVHLHLCSTMVDGTEHRGQERPDAFEAARPDARQPAAPQPAANRSLSSPPTGPAKAIASSCGRSPPR